MSTHLEFSLDSDFPTIEQKFTLLDERRVTSIAIKLHIFNDPAGTFTLKLKKDSTELASKSLTVSEMNTLIQSQLGVVHPYKIGYILFEFLKPVGLSRDIEYTLELSSSSYTFSASKSMGWIKEYLDETNSLTDVSIDDLGKAFSYRLWGWRDA